MSNGVFFQEVLLYLQLFRATHHQGPFSTVPVKAPWSTVITMRQAERSWIEIMDFSKYVFRMIVDLQAITSHGKIFVFFFFPV